MSTTTLPRPTRLGGFRPDGGIRSLVRGRTEDPAWARVALVGLLVATAVAYLWNLTASGDANSFYAAAVQAGTKSWKAFFFGSLDSSNFITVDKPPASLWVMALSGRIFGFSTASMLVPQVLEGVLAVGLLAASVKRWFGTGAGLLAGAMLAVTPVAALMFRFNNPDALLVCLLVASAYCLVRALERGSTRWMIGVGTLLGPHPGRGPTVGQLARRQRPRVQLERRRHPHLLHGGARAGDRRARRDRSGPRVAPA